MFQSLAELRSQFRHSGRVDWIGVRPARDEAMRMLETVYVDGRGLEGDRFAAKRSDVRTVTLIQAEHVTAVGALLNMPELGPASLRRNLMVSGLNLLALKGLEFQVGGAVLEFTGLCHPCSKMERGLGPGAYNAMRGHGGITARVIAPGNISVGDPVTPQTAASPVPRD